MARKCVKWITRPSNEDRMAVSCRRCGAQAGRKCTNYKGKGKQTCPGRGLTEEEAGPVYQQGELFGEGK